jgi:hypothetical protein
MSKSKQNSKLRPGRRSGVPKPVMMHLPPKRTIPQPDAQLPVLSHVTDRNPEDLVEEYERWDGMA